MKLFVGLGNPGAEYAGNRHNIGFMVLDRIAADHGFATWKRAFKGVITEGRLGAEKQHEIDLFGHVADVWVTRRDAGTA